jgi:bifunctional aspartokinase / homoserine dehydrogenase 1
VNDLLVMKFGGTSMGSGDRIRTAAQLSLEQQRTRPVVVVVSAMSKITDLLLETLTHAELGRPEVEANLKKLKQRHFEACEQLLPASVRAHTFARMESIMSEFQRIAHGVLMLGERPPRSVDEAVSTGEKLSALLISEYLNTQGVKSVAVNGSDVIVTDNVFGNATPLMGPTAEKARAKLLPLLEQGVLPIVTGFNGATAEGKPTTLGRGGSDFSASILAGVLDASELWIWTDVDGIMSADPRLVPDAAVLDEVTYNEAAELAYAGAKVLHPRTLAPLIEKRIPVWSKNSFKPQVPGTRILAKTAENPGPRAVTSMANVALVSIESANLSVNGTQIMGRALEALAQVNAEVLAFSSSSYRQSFCFLIRKDELTASMEELEHVFSLELAHGYLHPIDVNTDVGLLAVVGEGMQGSPGLAGRIFTAISRDNINIIAISQGSSELTIAIVVSRSGLEKAVQAVHAECELGNQGSGIEKSGSEARLS